MIQNKYVIVTKWCYPYGGGEEFMLQTMKWMQQMGYICIWLSFYNFKNEPFDKFLMDKTDDGYMLKIPGGFSSEKVFNWLKLLKPSLVHHQGDLLNEVFQVSRILRIQMVSGLHFWSNVIKLDPLKLNVEVLKNIEHHQIHEVFLKLFRDEYCTFYVPSDFMRRCIQKLSSIVIPHQVYPISLKDRCMAYKYDPIKNVNVTLVNMNKLKGGEFFIDLSRKLPHIPFLGICNDTHNNQIAIPSHSNLRIITEYTNIKDVYDETRILLIPSLVDETFSRVTNEGLMNGIPIITTGKGFIKEQLGYAGVILPQLDVNRWADEIESLYSNTQKLLDYSNDAYKQYESFNEDIGHTQFTQLVDSTIKKSKEWNVMILCPWCDQGLGIQSRNYYDMLSTEYNVFIFSYKPYNAFSTMELQADPSEWIGPEIYYSQNDREGVNKKELLEFVGKYDIGKCVIPEICWDNVYNISNILFDANVKIYAVPNVEIIIRSELYKYERFHKILCNNMFTYNALSKYKFKNLTYLGYSMMSQFTNKQLVDTFNILFIGGMNAFHRKQIIKVCDAAKNIPKIHLTCLIQKCKPSELRQLDDFRSVHNIEIINKHHTHGEINVHYKKAHFVIQVSRHEGLGLNFYEALASGTPVITIDMAPYNEIIKESINGYLINGYTEPNEENTDAIVPSLNFETNDLRQIFEQLDPSMYDELIKSTRNDYETRFNTSVFKNTIIDVLAT